MAQATRQEAVDRVTAEEVMQRMDRGETVVFVDTRNPQAWSRSNENAWRDPDPAGEVEQRLNEIPKGKLGRGLDSYLLHLTAWASSASVAQELTGQGYRDVYPL